MTQYRSLRCGIAALTVAVVVALNPGTAGGQSGSELVIDSIDMRAYPSASAIVVPPRDVKAAEIGPGSFVVKEGTKNVAVSVEALPTDKLAVALVIDTSGSMKGPAIVAAKKAAEGFVASMPIDTPLAVVGFGTAAKVYSPFTTDRTRSNAALRAMSVRGQTALHDALIAASKLFDDSSLPAGTRRVIVLLSDGGDTASKTTLADAARALERTKVSLSAVALATRESDTAALTVLATGSNGALASAADPAALNDIFAKIANNVLRQYRMRWTSNAKGATKVSVTLLAAGRTWESAREVSFPATSPLGPALPAVPTLKAVPNARRIGEATIGRGWLYTGIAAGFGSALLALGVLLWPKPAKRRLAGEFGVQKRKEVTGFTQGLINATQTYFRRTNRGNWLAALLERAGMAVDAPSAAVLIGALCLCGGLFGGVLAGVVGAIVVALMVFVLCIAIVKSRGDKRCALFQEQFDGALQIIINSLKSGYGVSQAIDTVARESQAPTSVEFKRIVTETTLGMDQIRALEACAARTGCQELAWVAECMEVNRDVGGQLSEVLVGIAGTIRARNRLARQVHSISAEGRLTAQVLFVMPFVAFLIQMAFNRKSMHLLFRGTGLAAFLIAMVLMAFGYYWVKTIIRIRY